DRRRPRVVPRRAAGRSLRDPDLYGLEARVRACEGGAIGRRRRRAVRRLRQIPGRGARATLSVAGAGASPARPGGERDARRDAWPEPPAPPVTGWWETVPRRRDPLRARRQAEALPRRDLRVDLERRRARRMARLSRDGGRGMARRASVPRSRELSPSRHPGEGG